MELGPLQRPFFVLSIRWSITPAVVHCVCTENMSLVGTKFVDALHAYLGCVCLRTVRMSFCEFVLLPSRSTLPLFLLNNKLKSSFLLTPFSWFIMVSYCCLNSGLSSSTNLLLTVDIFTYFNLNRSISTRFILIRCFKSKYWRISARQNIIIICVDINLRRTICFNICVASSEAIMGTLIALRIINETIWFCPIKTNDAVDMEAHPRKRGG